MNAQKYKNFGIIDADEIMKKGMSLEYAIKHCSKLLTDRAAEFAKKHFLQTS